MLTYPHVHDACLLRKGYVSDPVNSTPEEFENGLFLRSCQPPALIRHKNRAFRKRYLKLEEFESSDFSSVRVDGKHFENTIIT